MFSYNFNLYNAHIQKANVVCCLNHHLGKTTHTKQTMVFKGVRSMPCDLELCTTYGRIRGAIGTACIHHVDVKMYTLQEVSENELAIIKSALEEHEQSTGSALFSRQSKLKRKNEACMQNLACAPQAKIRILEEDMDVN